MVVLKRSVAVITLLLAGSLSEVSYAQYVLNPRSVTQLSEIFDDAKREQTYSLREDYDWTPSLSDKGLIILRGGWGTSSIIRTIDEDGTTIWEKRSPEGLTSTGVTVSPDGRFVSLHHAVQYLSEGMYELLTSEGQTLWTRRVVTGAHFLNSGGYLLLDGPNVVVDIRSGMEQWRIDQPFRIWKSGRGLVAAYLGRKNSTITVLDPTIGPSLRSQSIDEGFTSDFQGANLMDVIPSEDGKRLVLCVVKSVAEHYKYKTRIGGFNEFGRLLWSRDVNGHVTPLGITPDSRFLLAFVFRRDQTQLHQARQLEMIDANTGTAIWILDGPAGTWQYPAVLMNNRLFISVSGVRLRGESSSKHGTLILTIDSSGQLQDQALLSRKNIIYVGIRNGLHTSQEQPDQKTVLLLEDRSLRRGGTLTVETMRR